jgi:hypothetical protein
LTKNKAYYRAELISCFKFNSILLISSKSYSNFTRRRINWNLQAGKNNFPTQGMLTKHFLKLHLFQIFVVHSNITSQLQKNHSPTPKKITSQLQKSLLTPKNHFQLQKCSIPNFKNHFSSPKNRFPTPKKPLPNSRK